MLRLLQSRIMGIFCRCIPDFVAILKNFLLAADSFFGILQLVAEMVVIIYIILELRTLPYSYMTNSGKLKSSLFMTGNDNRAFLIRLVVGLIFLTEGMQKYLFPELLGSGRFEKIGFTDPAFWAYFTGTFEIICGIFLLLGFFTRMASIPLLIVMVTAFVTTKWTILADKGFWSFAHEYRTDFAMTLLLIWLLIYGAGRWSVDAVIYRRIFATGEIAS
jgi:uncharacterized membrane protein YphA (DoxX/SURF4 family)